MSLRSHVTSDHCGQFKDFEEAIQYGGRMGMGCHSPAGYPHGPPHYLSVIAFHFYQPRQASGLFQSSSVFIII